MSGHFLRSCYAPRSSYSGRETLLIHPSSLTDHLRGLTTLAGGASQRIIVSTSCSSQCPFMPQPRIPSAHGLLHASLRGVVSSRRRRQLIPAVRLSRSGAKSRALGIHPSEEQNSAASHLYRVLSGSE